MSEPTPENYARARLQFRHDADGELRCDVEDIAAALDAAELRGHTRAVEETAILSVHKAVAAERAAVVAWLRAQAMGDDFDGYEMRLLQERADAIERGDHREDAKP